MAEKGLNLAMFMDMVFWGNKDCVSDPKVRDERRHFFHGPQCARVLSRMWDPPTRMEQAPAVRDFVLDSAASLFDQELKKAIPLLSPRPDPLSKESLTSVDFQDIGQELQSEDAAPHLWTFLHRLALTPRQTRENKNKFRFHVVLMIISMLSYSRSSHVSRIPQLWSIYLKSCGLSARSFNALHLFKITMCHKWTANAYKTMATTAKAHQLRAIEECPFFGSHDNVNIPMRVFSQRLHNQSHFINATAGTIWILPERARLLPDIPGSQQRFSLFDTVFRTSPEVLKRVKSQAKWWILRFLINSPTFTDYPHRNDLVRAATPPPVDLLPCGKDSIVEQHFLETVEQDESTYAGTTRLFEKEWLVQLGISEDDDKRTKSVKRIIAWIGDQLTVERMRILARIRHGDVNSFERMDWLEPHFGWFHALMTVATSLHKQYLGTSAGVGLRKCFELLARKGLMKADTKGHIGEAHFQALWCEVGQVDSLTELKQLSPDELLTMLDKLHSENVTRGALEKFRMEDRDMVKEQMIMFGMDTLPYFDLREAIREGDVGRMEDLLPILLTRFAGGHNHKYVIEVLELLQKLHREWPAPFRDYVKHHCWLINRSGKRNGFLPRSFGPGANFEYIQKVSPAIPLLRAVKAHIRDQFSTIQARGTRHGTPSKEADVQKLVKMYITSGLHNHEPGRKPKSALDIATDLMTAGADSLNSDKHVDTWWDGRSVKRSAEEIYAMKDDPRVAESNPEMTQ
ncbi:uncharacterized protein BXZ73DRAFT_91408 [Epithele typhae]|uniref:uncharacterized protein n=1 Tax=Epithele typhae TaxID=378194 RepID=UPI00200728C3|nr:uncharacterized protein BXZ73DRAFT_91408 [Epithele typhae]KAH9923719.1 hypothetical protein BXZ73DRAFT_91408 [Epithele typhae]